MSAADVYNGMTEELHQQDDGPDGSEFWVRSAPTEGCVTQPARDERRLNAGDQTGRQAEEAREVVLSGSKGGRRLFQLLSSDVRVGAGGNQVVQVAMIGVAVAVMVVVVRGVISPLCMTVGVRQTRGLHREVAVRVDVDHETVRHAAAQEDANGKYEDDVCAA